MQSKQTDRQTDRWIDKLKVKLKRWVLSLFLKTSMLSAALRSSNTVDLYINKGHKSEEIHRAPVK